MLKKPASIVLAALTRTVKREARNEKRETRVSLGAAALFGKRRVSARRGWAGEKVARSGRQPVWLLRGLKRERIDNQFA